jgi:1,2-diacylglycerol 3-alpha-glucosyltransferase
VNIGIVTTWFERGAAYVSKQFEDVLSADNNVFIYVRGGEKYAIGDSIWDKENVTWGKRRKVPFSGGGTVINKKDFLKWLNAKNIDIVLFNEQEWLYPLLWCNEIGIPTIGYVDYYKKDTVKLFGAYTALICNTKRHFSVFNWHQNSYYVPWGTNVDKFKPNVANFKLVNKDVVTFFHSCGMDPYRKGTEILIQAANKIDENFKLIIHSQIDLKSYFDAEIQGIIDKLINLGILEIIIQTVSAPGLNHLGDVYVYPSRLEGIGLTIAEAQACGLVPIVTNNAPMNEFVNDNTGFLIDVSSYYSRYDAYYWPECMPDVNSLIEQMSLVASQKEKIEVLKKANYEYAREYLDWNKNSVSIKDIFENLQYIKLDKKTINEVVLFEESGFRKLTRLYNQNYFVFSLIMGVITFLLVITGFKKKKLT